MHSEQGGNPWGQREADNTSTARVTGVVLATLVAAGCVGYILRRARRKEASPPASFAETAGQPIGDVIGDRPAEAARNFLTTQVLPELKPAILAVLEELEAAVDAALERSKKALKDL
jgi:hypothetical protein